MLQVIAEHLPRPLKGTAERNINNMEKYTIICSIHTCGQIAEVVNKEQVRSECERFKNLQKLGCENTYARIEVVNNQTGEIKEYWNNIENKINF